MKLDVKISKRVNDIIQKYASGLFKNTTLEFYGIKAAKIKELVNIELPVIEVSESSADFAFLLEDDTYLHFEFQTAYNKKDLIRFAHYNLRLYERDGRKIHSVIIYAADVKKAPDDLNIGSLIYTPDKIMMVDYDGDNVYHELNAKIKAGSELTDLDILNLILLPLMKNNTPRDELAATSIKLAQNIPDPAKRTACIAAAFAFASKYLDKHQMEKLMEVLKMVDWATMLVGDAVDNAVEKNTIEITTKMLKEGIGISSIVACTGLEESFIRKLKAELDQKESA